MQVDITNPVQNAMRIKMRTLWPILAAKLFFAIPHCSAFLSFFASTQQPRTSLPVKSTDTSSSVKPHQLQRNGYSEGVQRTTEWSRRDLISFPPTVALLLSGTVAPKQASALGDDTTTPISASWSAVDGLNSLDSSQQFVSFDVEAYRAMRDDPTRTPQFQKAIQKRLGNSPETQVVLDLGTGPFALFAIIAASLGAGRVYAIEASPQAAKSARSFIKKAGFSDVITVLEGFSTQVELPEKADFCIAEIVGSIASEEGAYATIRDAHARFVKQPDLDSSWIPARIQTYAAPASYSLHNLFGPPEFDWSKLKGEPVRFNCRDPGLELLSDPVLIEDVVFSEVLSPKQEARNGKKQFTFVVDKERVKENTLTLYDEFRRGKSTVFDSEILAMKTSHSFSGIAMWPRIILDDDIIVDSRHFGDGGPQRSHWQTVLPIMSSRPVGDLEGGEKIWIETDFRLPTDVTKPPTYSIRGEVRS